MINFACDNESESGHAEAYKDAIHEDAIKVGGSTKAPDCCFRIGLPESRQPRTRCITVWQTSVSESGSCQVAE